MKSPGFLASPSLMGVYETTVELKDDFIFVWVAL
jgi:hypothetical protein